MFHNIHLNELPPEGKLFEGEFRNDIFGLRGEADPRFRGPVVFSVNVRIDGPWIVAEGSISARFELECARCGGWFQYEVALDDYAAQEPREGETILDLTAQIREDILLALPGYPRCEESNLEDRTCPAAEQFSSESDFIPLTEEPAADSPPRADVWNVLDQLPGVSPKPRS